MHLRPGDTHVFRKTSCLDFSRRVFPGRGEFGIDCSRALAVGDFQESLVRAAKFEDDRRVFRGRGLRTVLATGTRQAIAHNRHRTGFQEDPLEPPSKWTCRWSAYRISRRVSENHHLEFVHCKTDETVKSNVNRLSVFHPRNDDLPSACPEINDGIVIDIVPSRENSLSHL